MIFIHTKIWCVAEPQLEIQRNLVRELQIPEILARILINRGIITPGEARSFLAGDLDQLHDPYLLPGMDEAVNRIMAARERAEKVLVFGDYDVDGVTSTVVLLTVLRELGIDAHYYIPDRLEEGYGLNSEALEWARAEGFSLVVTVDCGITAVEEVARGRELGLDIVITDHHEPHSKIPAALAVIDPKLSGCRYPWPELAGVGVVFKLSQALLAKDRGERPWSRVGLELLDVVALGTIADIVPLKGENRVLVKHGLKALRETKRLGLRALVEVCGLEGREITAGHVGFMLAPRINATGRLGSAAMAVELLLSQDEEQARQLAVVLDKENQERQAVEGAILAQVIKTIEEEYDLEHNPVIVLGAEEWHHGVVGIVASRVVDRYHRPAILIGLEGEEGKGSCRSINGFNMFLALQACERYLTRFGGHKQAAGLSLKRENLAAFREAVNDYARANLTLADLTPKVEADGLVALHQLNEELLEKLEQLEPFGYHNPSPLLLCRGARLQECRPVGKKGDHLKLKVKSDKTSMDGIGFNLGGYAEIFRPREEVDLAFALDRNQWNGKVSIQLKVKDLKSSRQADNPLEIYPNYYLDKYDLKNLDRVKLFDLRGCHDRYGYLRQLVNRGQTAAVCVFSQALEGLTRESSGQDGIVYYPFDFNRDEGINLSHVENVILYHPGLGFDDFFRLLRDFNLVNPEVKLHLLFGQDDLRKGQLILESRYPERELLGRLYRLLKGMGDPGTLVPVDMEKLVLFLRQQGFSYVTGITVEQGLAIFGELGLIEEPCPPARGRQLKVVPFDGKVDLDSSAIYRQGLRVKDIYQSYGRYILDTPVEKLLGKKGESHEF